MSDFWLGAASREPSDAAMCGRRELQRRHVRGLLRRNPGLNIVRVRDAGLSGADDPAVLEWAAGQGRVVITHDVSTLTKHAFNRLAAGHSMPGVFEVRSVAGIGQAIDDLLLLAECSHEGEWWADGRIYFLSEEGVATVIAPGKVFSRLAVNQLDGATLASIAVSGGPLYIRSHSHLYRIGARQRP